MSERRADDAPLTSGEKAYWRRRCQYAEDDLASTRADIERLATAINANQHRLIVPRVPQGMSAIDAAIEVVEGRGTRIVEPLGCPTPGACSCPMPVETFLDAHREAGYKMLVASLEAQIRHYRANQRIDEAARSSLDSERAANAALTDELDALRAAGPAMPETPSDRAVSFLICKGWGMTVGKIDELWADVRSALMIGEYK